MKAASSLRQERHGADDIVGHLRARDRLRVRDRPEFRLHVASPGRGRRAMVPGVRVSAGAIALTVMPCGPSSVASTRVSPMMPPLLAT